MRHFQNAEDVYFAEPQEYAQVPELPEEALQSLQEKSLEEAEKILFDCHRKEIRILTWQEEDYPVRLRNIPDPPMVLYCRGTLPEFDRLPMIGIVGTRKASTYGLATARQLGGQIARCGGVVVSGMAKGIDAMATTGALDAGAAAVGVLGNGVDIVYPAANRELFARMERQGCLISEYPPGTPPSKWSFPQRNRLISGLSVGVLVVEAPEKSGALITANLALEQGRDVFAVPGNLGVESCAGSNRLLREGAILAASGWDVLSEYQFRFPERICKNDAPIVLPQAREPERTHLLKVANGPLGHRDSRALPEYPRKNVVDNGAVAPYSDVNKAQPALTGDAKVIADALSQGALPVDEVIAQTGLPAAKVLSLLTLLEIRGVLRRLPGKRVELL